MTLGQLILGCFAGFGMYRAACEVFALALPRYARWRSPEVVTEPVTEQTLDRWAKAEADRRARRAADRKALARLTDSDRATIAAVIIESGCKPWRDL
jgi:hypothetical protein